MKTETYYEREHETEGQYTFAMSSSDWAGPVFYRSASAWKNEGYVKLYSAPAGQVRTIRSKNYRRLQRLARQWCNGYNV